ncbi:MAG: hypothetical protein FD153_1359 [Rhodospirillaceae bacterium]|nr:MAG: hypothetical protein FD153_1359 [Rhodospirillaceae bacterium]
MGMRWHDVIQDHPAYDRAHVLGLGVQGTEGDAQPRCGLLPPCNDLLFRADNLGQRTPRRHPRQSHPGLAAPGPHQPAEGLPDSLLVLCDEAGPKQLPQCAWPSHAVAADDSAVGQSFGGRAWIRGVWDLDFPAFVMAAPRSHWDNAWPLSCEAGPGGNDGDGAWPLSVTLHASNKKCARVTPGRIESIMYFLS